MKQLRHSRQRDTILNYLSSHHIHPTAEEVYDEVRKDIPNISLGTVYRNLALLEKLGLIRSISYGTNAERFDGDLSDHHHFICDECGQVYDISLNKSLNNELKKVSFDGDITSCDIVFHGKCRNCAG